MGLPRPLGSRYPWSMPDAALALLQEHGYAVRFRVHEWVECLVTQGDEAWVGRGRDKQTALETALALACPSALSQALLKAAISRGASPSPAPPRPAPRAPSARNPRSSVPLVGRGPPPTPDLDRSLDELSVLLERVRASREDLGLCAPERQRLAILAWICEARAHTEPFPNERRVRDAVAAVSKLLTDLGKAFWPGSVTALQLQMTPAELPRHLLGGVAVTWSRAAELAEAQLQASLLRDDIRGHDAYGWADGRALWPRPRDAAERLQALVAEIEHASGPLDRHAPPRSGAPKPDPGTYVRWVRELRWLRGTEPERWARVAGRLRWWAGRRDGSLQPGVRTLDPAFVPAEPWSEVLGLRHEAETSDEDPAPLPEALVHRIRDRVQGKRLVWVGPRRDPGLQRVLTDTLVGAELDWRLSEQSRLQALEADIEKGRWDVVLGALGLQAKTPDLRLARACRAHGITYVRVHRGEAWSCLRGLARGAP